MTLEKVTLLAGILFAAVSCSMEDDLINTAPKDKTADGFACITLGVSTKGLDTKAGSSTTDGTEPSDAIKDCSLIILNEDNTVYAAFDDLVVESGEIKTAAGANPFLVQAKVNKSTGKTFQLMVVANTGQSYANCANLTAVKAVVLRAADMNRNVKVSDPQSIDVSGYETLAEAVADPYSVDLVAQQLTAQIQLDQVNVSFKAGTKAVDVAIKDITLKNRNTTSATILDDAANKTYDSYIWPGDALPVMTNGVATYTDVVNKPFFNTFSNATPAAGKETILSFTLVYNHADGTKEKDFEFAINRPDADDFDNGAHDYIKSGFVYKVRINASLTSNSIDCSFKCYTLDWLDNAFEIDMIEQ